MNNMIISSDCTSCIIYKQIIDKEYDNPFMSTIVNGKDFNYLIKHINDIDFTNYHEFTINHNNFNGGEKTYGIHIDNKIKLLFPHHNNMNDIIKMYNQRSLRLINNIKLNNNIVFILNERKFDKQLGCDYSFKDFENFCKLKTNYKRILITSNKKFKKYESANLRVCVKNNFYVSKGTVDFTKNIFYDNYKDFLNE